MSYTQSIFTVGFKYRVRQSFRSGASAFVTGEILIFDRNTYSPYDNSFVYLFHPIGSDEVKGWWLHEEKSKELWHQYFELLPNQSV
jgi:hypothetical protein